MSACAGRRDRIARQESLIQQLERKGHAQIAKIGRSLLRLSRGNRLASCFLSEAREHLVDCLGIF